MRRLLGLPGLAALAVALIFGLWAARERARPRYPTIPLADGTLLKIEGFTWGSNQVFRLHSKPITWIYSRLPISLRRRLPPFQNDRSLLEIEGFPEFPRAHLWFSRWNPASKAYLSVNSLELFEIDEPGGDYGSLSFGSGRASHAQTLRVVSWREPRLTFRIVINGQTNQVVVDNPRKGEVFPVWSSPPLPQSLSTNGFEFTVERVEFQPVFEPMWQPKVAAKREGRDVSSWFEWQNVWTDPTGNRDYSRLPASEPVWCAELLAYPTAQFPFPEGQGVSLGRHVVPDPGIALSIPLDSTLTDAGVRSVWLTGPGYFTFKNGSNVFASLPDSTRSPHRISSGPGYWEGSFNRATPHLHLWPEGPATGTRLLAESHREDLRVLVRGRRIDGSSQGGFAFGSSSSSIPRLRRIMGAGLLEANSGETLDFDLRLVEPWPLTFTFPAPTTPARP
ncbi:MAG TPA: hypothetical protein PLX89_03400 [Verrucomicrobiota bacterium]|nr:hypothetical protein [Verrucomicrobiota bacterium]